MISGLNSTNAGDYSVVVSNLTGSVTSAVATITMVLPPTFSVQPASQGVLSGSNVTLNATVTGTGPFHYSWYFNSTNLIQDGSVSALTINNFGLANIGNYAPLSQRDAVCQRDQFSGRIGRSGHCRTSWFLSQRIDCYCRRVDATIRMSQPRDWRRSLIRGISMRQICYRVGPIAR